MNDTYKLTKIAALIHPARFLFDADATLADFNYKMLNNPHFKVIKYFADYRTLFAGSSIKIRGSIAMTLYDENQNFGAIKTFMPFNELKSIHDKVIKAGFKSFSEIVYSRAMYRFAETNVVIGTNAFDVFKNYFRDEKLDEDSIQVIGRKNNEHVCKWIQRKYICSADNLDKYKVFIASSSGDGVFGEAFNTLIVAAPQTVCTETFTSVGAFDTAYEVEACKKYIKTKFARALLGILKATHHNAADTWSKVPLQDFTDKIRY